MNDVNKVIVFQGDSITDCGRNKDNPYHNSGLGCGYPLLVAASLLVLSTYENLHIYNRGRSGDRVIDLYARWKYDCLNLKPDIVSILIGVNDTWHEYYGCRPNGINVIRYEKIYRDIIEWTVEELPHVKLLLCEPFVFKIGVVEEKWIEEIKCRGEIVRKLSNEFKFCCSFVPFQEVLNNALKKAYPQYWLSDGVHPTTAGHKLLADMWLQYYKNIYGNP
jgi:acyl-CoA thioesterase I